MPIMRKSIQVRLEEEMLTHLNEVCKRRGSPREEIIRRALRHYLPNPAKTLKNEEADHDQRQNASR